MRNEEIAQRINIKRLASGASLVTIALMFAFLIYQVIGVRIAQTEISSPIFPTVLFVVPIEFITAIEPVAKWLVEERVFRLIV